MVAETVSLITKRIGKQAGLRFGNVLGETRIIQILYTANGHRLNVYQRGFFVSGAAKK